MGNAAGQLLCLGWEGTPRWRTALAREVASRPAHWEDWVVAATVGGEWVGLALQDGSVRWRLLDSLPVTQPLVTDGSTVFGLGADGSVQAVEPRTGAVLWVTRPPSSLRRLERPVLAGPVLAGGALILRRGEAQLVALDPATGRLLWRAPFEDARALSVEGERVLAVSRDGRLAAFDARHGQLLWDRALGASPTSPVEPALGKLWVAVLGPQAGTARLLGLRRTDGQLEAEHPLPAPATARVLQAGRSLVVPTAGREGLLLALDVSNLTPLGRHRLDSPLRTQAVSGPRGEVHVVATDGRVLRVDVRGGRVP